MWHLTILYLYVNINTCCCITNGIKKGWLKCWMSESSACVERVQQGAAVMLWPEQQPCRNMSVPSAGCSRAGDGAGARCLAQRHPLLLLRVSAGDPDTSCDIPGTRSHSSCCSPPAWHTMQPPVYCPPCVSLFAGAVPYRNAWREQKSQAGCFPAAGSVLVGQFSLCVTLLTSSRA